MMTSHYWKHSAAQFNALSGLHTGRTARTRMDSLLALDLSLDTRIEEQLVWNNLNRRLLDQRENDEEGRQALRDYKRTPPVFSSPSSINNDLDGTTEGNWAFPNAVAYWNSPEPVIENLVEEDEVMEEVPPIDFPPFSPLDDNEPTGPQLNTLLNDNQMIILQAHHTPTDGLPVLFPPHDTHDGPLGPVQDLPGMIPMLNIENGPDDDDNDLPDLIPMEFADNPLMDNEEDDAASNASTETMDSDDEEENIPPVEQTAENLTNAMVDNTVTKEIRSRVDSRLIPSITYPLRSTSHAHPWGIIDKELAHRIQDVTFPLDKQVIRNAAGFIVPADTTPRSPVILIKGRVFLADRGNPWRPEVRCFYDATTSAVIGGFLHHEIPSLLDEIRQHLAPWYILEALDSQKGHCQFCWRPAYGYVVFTVAGSEMVLCEIICFDHWTIRKDKRWTNDNFTFEHIQWLHKDGRLQRFLQHIDGPDQTHRITDDCGPWHLPATILEKDLLPTVWQRLYEWAQRIPGRLIRAYTRNADHERRIHNLIVDEHGHDGILLKAVKASKLLREKQQKISLANNSRWIIFALHNRNLLPERTTCEDIAKRTICAGIALDWCSDLVYTAAVIFLANPGIIDPLCHELYWYGACYKACVNSGCGRFGTPQQFATVIGIPRQPFVNAVRHYDRIYAYGDDLCWFGRQFAAQFLIQNKDVIEPFDRPPFAGSSEKGDSVTINTNMANLILRNSRTPLL